MTAKKPGATRPVPLRDRPVVEPPEKWVRLVWKIVHEMKRPGEDVHALFSAGSIGLLHAVRKQTDAVRGSFAAYAGECICRHIIGERWRERNVRQARRWLRVPLGWLFVTLVHYGPLYTLQ